MLLLFNKTIKPLNQFVKKIQKSVLGAAVEDPFYHFIFSHFFFVVVVTHKFLWTLALCKISKKEQTVVD